MKKIQLESFMLMPNSIVRLKFLPLAIFYHFMQYKIFFYICMNALEIIWTYLDLLEITFV